jgi:hypothetical protein
MKRNKIQIGIGGIENLLMNMVLKKKLKKHIDPKNTFAFLFTWESNKHISIWDYHPKG